jgi:hypothetical protein
VVRFAQRIATDNSRLKEAKLMAICPLSGEVVEPESLGIFVMDQFLYHEACVPNCANCGSVVPHYNCDRIWDDDPPNGDWRASHKRC